MSDIVISVENLSKQYRLGTISGSTLREDLSQWWTNFSKHQNQSFDEIETIWALSDVNFKIKQGEAVGIIGRNGAGKSTLLKILSRITAPSTGQVKVKGRIGSLLEVGTGFHPELTGRENVYLNGAILGMNKGEINRKFNEIVDFSGIEQFIDTPVKRYSSGMKVRLAFAVAAYLEPEILLIDEVLAVGDAEFQKRCLQKMDDVTAEGRTVLFVSHQMQAIATLTNRCILMTQGQLQTDGPTSRVIDTYLTNVISNELFYLDKVVDSVPKVTEVKLETSDSANTHIHGKPLYIEVEVATAQPINGAGLSVQIMNSLGESVMNLWLYDSKYAFCRKPGRYKLVCHIPKFRLYQGRYNLTVYFAERTRERIFQRIEGICPFEVVMHGIQRDWPWREAEAVYIEDCNWDVIEII